LVQTERIASTSMTKPNSVDENAVLLMEKFLCNQEKKLLSSLQEVFGEIPKWAPSPSLARVKRIVQSLLNDGFSAQRIIKLMNDADKSVLEIPGSVIDPGLFTQSLYELLHFKSAVAMKELSGLKMLAGEDAEHGKKFRTGRKKNARSPIGKWIETQLKKSPSISARDLWEKLRKEPLDDWDYYPSGRGVDQEYFMGPGGRELKFRSFENRCSKVRNKITV